MNERPNDRSRDALIRSLLRNKRGSVAVYLTLAAAIFLPMAAFTIDATRYWGLNTDLKNAAESAALAAAMAVGPNGTSLEAARQAAQNAVDNYQIHADDGGADEIATDLVLFLWALPPAPQTNYEDYKTTDPAQVRYVVVRTETRAMSSAAMLAFAAWSGRDFDIASKTTAALAISARRIQACKVMPLMTCNPVEPIPDGYEGDSGGLNLNPADVNCPGDDCSNLTTFGEFLRLNPQWTRRMMRIKAIGPGEEYAPGAFGLLEANFTTKKGANAIEEELAQTTPDSCITVNAVGAADIKTGQAQGIVDGLNVRFDMWNSWLKNRREDLDDEGDPLYLTSPSVIKGRLPKETLTCTDGSGAVCDPATTVDCNCVTSENVCSTRLASFDPSVPEPVTSMKLPQDECFTVDNLGEFNAINNSGDGHKCYMLGDTTGDDVFNDTGGNNKGFNGRYGNGHWDIREYFWVNHRDLMTLDAQGEPQFDLPAGWGDVPGFLEHIRSHSSAITLDTEEFAGNVNVDDPPSRYSVWLWELRQRRQSEDAGAGFEDVTVADALPAEIAGDHIPMPPDDAASYNDALGASILKEKGEPQCQSNPEFIGGPERRHIYIAIVNCLEYEDEISSGQRVVPVLEILEGFLTEPADPNSAGGGSDMGAIYLEPIRTLEVGGQENVVLREIIQLY